MDIKKLDKIIKSLLRTEFDTTDANFMNGYNKAIDDVLVILNEENSH